MKTSTPAPGNSIQVESEALKKRKCVKEKYKYVPRMLILFRDFKGKKQKKQIQTTGKNKNNIPAKICFRALFIECFLTVIIINMICSSYI